MSDVTEPCPLKEPKKKPISIRVSIFFDGTLNNRANSSDQTKTIEFKNKNGSYENDTTNIAKLELMYTNDQDADFSGSIYLEGIGTEDFKADSDIGAALGMGATGVKGKVEKCMELLGAKLKKFAPDVTVPITYVYLDVLGFSRGSAAARYCIHLALEDTWNTITVEKWLSKQGYSVGVVKVKFVGLFDTVASFGVKHSNDTAELSLDSIRKAEKVVQLAAADEHRANFRLTNINSAGTKGTQIFLPGVHSDIGGSYQNNSSEDLTLFSSNKGDARIAEENARLIASGWYKESEITLVDRVEYIYGGPGRAVPIYYTDIKVNRNGIKNTYSHIPLGLMAKLAKESSVIFNKDDLDDLYPIPRDLRWIKDEVEKADTKKSADQQINSCCNDGRDCMKKLRHDYFHFSAYYGATLGANDPQFVGNKRKRIIQNG